MYNIDNLITFPQRYCKAFSFREFTKDVSIVSVYLVQSRFGVSMRLEIQDSSNSDPIDIDWPVRASSSTHYLYIPCTLMSQYCPCKEIEISPLLWDKIAFIEIHDEIKSNGHIITVYRAQIGTPVKVLHNIYYY